MHKPHKQTLHIPRTLLARPGILVASLRWGEVSGRNMLHNPPIARGGAEYMVKGECWILDSNCEGSWATRTSSGCEDLRRLKIEVERVLGGTCN